MVRLLKRNQVPQTDVSLRPFDRLYLPRKSLDNPHKAETWKVYREDFAVNVQFGAVEESSA